MASRRARPLAARGLAMKRILIVCISVLILGSIGATALAAEQQPAQTQGQQGDFVPMKNLPQQEQLPAAPLVTGAYAFVWVVLVLYVWSLSRRVKKVQSELTDLRQRSRTNR